MGKRAHHPRRGSLGYSPRKRARSKVARIRSWISEDRVRIQGFAGYKAGTIHVIVEDEGERALAATVIETPPLRVCGFRLYGRRYSGLEILSEVWAEDVSKDLARVFVLPKKFKSDIAKAETQIEKTEEIRLIIHTQPRLSSVPSKKPEIMEYRVGGPIKEAFEYAKGLLGNELRVQDIFEEGEFVDVASITKGKGFQGPVKKWGVKHLPRKTRKGHRTAGTLGPWHPSAMVWRVPQGGQMGYHQRTELNKEILKVGENGEEVTPKGGFVGYGYVTGDFVMVKGSVPGPRKRLIRLRTAVRPPKKKPAIPRLKYISIKSKQGV